MLSALLVLCTGCRNEIDSQTDPDSSIPESTAQTEQETVSDTESELETQSYTNAAFPEADMNAVNFNDGSYHFVTVMNDDASCAEGELSVENIDGNFMLKFTDLSTDSENLTEAVQKIRISVGQLLNPDQLESVRHIGFDLYAEAKENLFQNDDGEFLQVPGWIGGSGGTVCADGEWYDFADFAADDVKQYDLQRSDACHVKFQFLLAESGKCWDSSVEDVNFTVMRKGMQNISDFYLDNIVFYDEEGNSIPLHISLEEKQAS